MAITKKMTKKEANEIVGRLSNPRKMPSHSISTPAWACITGSKMAEVPGTICHNCYAKKGMYVFDNVKEALVRRLEALKDPRWVEAMVTLLKKEKYFRWHDSGDIQGEWHLEMICEVARRTPETKHWLPTREYALVGAYFLTHEMPENLNVRISASKIDGRPPEALARTIGGTVSGVASIGKPFSCPASKHWMWEKITKKDKKTGEKTSTTEKVYGYCVGRIDEGYESVQPAEVIEGDKASCHACWNKKIFRVDYKYH